MIRLHKLNGDSFVLNSAHIEKIESVPDTTIVLTNDRVYIVQESSEEIINQVVQFNRLAIDGRVVKNSITIDNE